MKVNEKCLPCLINQVIKVANMTDVQDKETLYKKVFTYLSTIDFDMTNPEIIGIIFEMVKDNIGNSDPYFKIRNHYNQLFLDKTEEIEDEINSDVNSLEKAVKYAIIANIIDFNPMHNQSLDDMLAYFDKIDQLELAVNHIQKLKKDIIKANTLLYLGDNCGEICFDKILIKKIKELNPNIQIYFGVRGKPVVNDSIEEDAYKVGIDAYATIISNGDSSLGTVLKRTSKEFKTIFNDADVIIAKGQANFESLSDELNNIYFLLMVKCEVISEYISVPQKSLVCMQGYNKNKIVQ